MNLRIGILLVLLGFQTISAFAQSKLSVSITNPSSLDLCIPSDYLEVEVRNITTSSVSGIETEVELPTGVEYISGSLNSTGVTEKNISNLSKPVFSVSSLGLAQAATIRIRLNISCAVSAFLNNGGLAIVKTTTIYSGGSVAKNSSPLNIKQPSLQIQSISNQLKTASLGEVFTRQVVVKNSGTGKLSELRVLRIPQVGIDLLSAGGRVVTQSGDTLITTLDSNDFKTIGNGDIYFDLNETYSLTDSFKVISCDDLVCLYRADWGCDNERCNAVQSSTNVTISSVNPKLIVSPISYTSRCMDHSYTHDQELVIYNDGNDTARGIDINVLQGVNTGYYNRMASEIEFNSFTYQRGRTATVKSVSPYKTQNTINSGVFSCLSANPLGQVFVKIPDMAPGDSIVLKWQSRSCIPEVCNAGGFYTQRWKYNVSYMNQCDKVLKTGEQWGSYGYYNGMYFSKFIPTDIMDGQEVRLEYSLSTATLINPINRSQLKVQMILPSGITHSQNASDFKFAHPNGTSWAADYFTLQSDTLTAVFNGVPTVTFPRSELLIDLLGDCNGISSNKTLTYQLEVSYNPDTACTNNGYIPIYCDADQLKLHCAPSCNAGLHFNGFEAKRISYGEPDNNNDGIADASGTIDLDKIKTNRVMFGDTVLTTFRSKVYNAGSTTNWYYGKATSTLDYGRYLSVADVTIKIYRGGNLLFNCSNIQYTSTASGNSKTFTFDISYNNLASSGCTLYSSFAYLNVDSIELEVKYVVDLNPGNAILDLNFENDFYLSTVANPTASQKFQCDTFSAKLSLIGYYFTNYGRNTFVNQGCGDVYVTQNYYLSVGRCCTNYGGGNIFPYEYRQFAKLHDIIFKKPEGFDVKYSRFIQYRTKGTGYVETQVVDTIFPNSTSPTQYVYSTDSLYEDNGGSIRISDDGFHGNFTAYLTPNCKANDGLNVFDYGFVFEKLGPLGSGLDTLFANTNIDIVDYDKPQVDLTVANNYVYADTDTVEWDIRVSNTETDASVLNFWLGAIKNSNTELIQIVDLATGDTLERVRDIFRLGDLSKLEKRDLRLRAVYQQCDEDSIELLYGFNCTGYPDSIGDYPCLPETLKLYYKPINTRLEASLLDTATVVDLCENKEYTVQIRNTGTPRVYDPFLDILVRPGMILDDTAWIYIEGSTDSVYVSTPTTVGPNTYRWELFEHDSDLINSGLKGVNDGSGYSLKLKFKLKTDCDFTSGSFFLIKPGGYLKCGNPVNAAFTVGDPINIKGVSKPYFSATSFYLNPLDVCNYTDSSFIKFINLGPDTTGLTDKIIVSLPRGIEVDTNYVDNGHNAPSAVPQFKLLNGENTYSWSIPNGITAGDSSVFFFKTILKNEDLDCGDKQMFAQAVISQPVICIEDSSSCNINVATSSVLLTDSVIKAIYDLQFISATSVPSGSNEVVDLKYQVSNSGSDKTAGTLLVAQIVYDANGNGIVDSSDSWIASDSIYDPMVSGASIERSLDFDVGSDLTCNLLIYLGDENCACNEVTIDIETVQLINAGTDTLVCPNTSILIGTQGTSNVTYSWNNSSFLSDADSSYTYFTGINNNKNIDTAVMVLTTDKGNCSTTDTVLVFLHPGMRIALADTTDLCKGDKALIGEVVDGGTGRIKTYSWTPIDSLSKPDGVRTYANPLLSTLYNLEVTDDEGCKLYDSIYVKVFERPDASIQVIDSCVNTSFALENTTNYYGSVPDSIHWDVGGFVNSQFNDPLVRIDTAGKFKVYLYVDNSLGCWDTASTSLEVFPEPVSDISLYNDCEGDTTLIRALSTIASGSVSNTWLIEGQSFTGDSIVYSLPSRASVEVELTAVSDKGCKNSSLDTLGIYTKPVIQIQAQNTCLGDSVVLSATDNSASTDSITSYSWLLGDGTMLTSAEVIHTYSDSGSYSIDLTVINESSCIDTANEVVNIYSLPNSAFTLNDACYGDSIFVIDASTLDHGTIVSWEYDMGQGYIASNKDVVIKDAAVGEHIVKQRVKSTFGCLDSSINSFDVYYKDKVSWTVSGNCINELISMNVLPQSPDSISKVQWIVEGDTFTGNSISHIFSSAGDHIVKIITETNRSCVSDTTFTIRVDPAPVAVIQADQFCNDNQIEFSASGNKLLWDLGDGTTSTSSNFIHNFPDKQTYTVQLVIENSFGCFDTTERIVQVDNIVVPDFLISDICQFDQQTVYNTTAGNGTPISSAVFDMGNGDFISDLDSFVYAYDKAGTFNVHLTITTSAGCEYDTAQLVTIHPKPYSDFEITPEQADIFSSHIEIIDWSSGADSIVYTISDGSTYISSEFEHDFLDSGTFVIKQWVTTQFGCMDSTEREVFIAFAYKLFIPNAFSPNNDGINEVFKPLGFGLAEFDLSIYNRWGELIFQSSRPNEAWTGKDAIPGYYMYKIKALDFENGVHNYSGVVYLMK